MADKLTAKQEAFAVAYLTNGGNASEAYRAGYDNYTMSDEAVRVEAHRTLHLPNVSLRISRAIQRAARKHDVTIEKVIGELSLIAFQRGNDIYAEDGTILPPSEWDDATSATIAGVEVFEEFEGRGESREMVGYTRKVKFWPKVEALRDLLKQLSGGDTLKVVVGAMSDEERESRKLAAAEQLAELIARGHSRRLALSNGGGNGSLPKNGNGTGSANGHHE